MCAPCNAARTPPLLMFRRKNWQNWKRRRPNRRSPNLQPARRRQRNERAFLNRHRPRKVSISKQVGLAVLSLLLAGGAVVGLLLCLIGAITSPLQFSFSWLFGFIYFFTLCCGCLFWTIVHHATDAQWSVVVRRQLENIALFFAPSLFLRSRFCCSAIIFLSG